MTPLAAGYQHFADGAPFAEIALRHPAVREVYFPWVDEPSGRPKLGFEEEDDPDELAAALKRDLTRLRNAGVGLDLLLNANCYGAEAMVRVAKTARECLGCEVLIVNSPLHCDRRPHTDDNLDAPLSKMPFSAAWMNSLMGGKLEYGKLKTMCERNVIQWWDETTPCYTWLFGSGLPFEGYSRDAVHSGEYGKQIIGRIMLGYLMTGK